MTERKTERKLIRLEVKTNDGEIKVFDEEPIFNFDAPANCFIVSFKNQLEIFFFPVANIIFMKTNYRLIETKPILIPRINLQSSEAKN